jgi:hypothetical protein
MFTSKRGLTASFFFSFNFIFMPKIRFSALVSEMKGKANGSVFSKNAGGAYFRNNPSGGGKKSAKWDKQKGNLSSIARAWKSLTSEQQEAWNSIVTQYPTTDAFGNIRYPSGYELFCRLNGKLVSALRIDGVCSDDEDCGAGCLCIDGQCTPVSVDSTAGFPIMVTPASPRTVPSVGIVSLTYSDLFQLNPGAMFAMFDKNDLSLPYSLTSLNVIDDQEMFAPQSFAFRFQANKKQYQVVNPSARFGMYAYKSAAGHGWFVNICNVTNVSFDVEVIAAASGGILTYTQTILENLFQKDYHFAMVAPNNPDNALELYIDSHFYEIVGDITGAPTNIGGEYQQIIRNADNVGIFNFFVSDYRYYKYGLTGENVRLVSSGYVLDSEFVILDCITRTGAFMRNFGTGDSAFNFLVSSPDTFLSRLTPTNFALLPDFNVTVENEGLTGMYINIYASPPGSWGKNGNVTNLKLLGTYQWLTATSFNIVRAYKSVFGNVPPNSNIEIYVQALDSTTGDTQANKTKKKKNTTRFKAGADLTEKVN